MYDTIVLQTCSHTVVREVILEVSITLIDWARFASNSGDTTADLLCVPSVAYLLEADVSFTDTRLTIEGEDDRFA